MLSISLVFLYIFSPSFDILNYSSPVTTFYYILRFTYCICFFILLFLLSSSVGVLINIHQRASLILLINLPTLISPFQKSTLFPSSIPTVFFLTSEHCKPLLRFFVLFYLSLTSLVSFHPTHNVSISRSSYFSIAPICSFHSFSFSSHFPQFFIVLILHLHQKTQTL